MFSKCLHTPPMNMAGCNCVLFEFFMKQEKNIDPEQRQASYGAGKIIVRGARTHNLKNINVEMPRNKMVVITGVSGSGKSSLAFDTIFAEGQRRYVESLSSYARQFLNQMPKPDVDEITGLSPAISIDQKPRSNNPRSTVATITEIYDYLRVMYARIGHPHCPLCGEEIKKLSNEEILNFVQSRIKVHSSISIFSPVVRGRKGEYYQLLYDLLGKGFSEIRLDGEMKRLREQITLSKYKAHNIDILVDSFPIDGMTKEELRMRLSEAIERALIESDNLVTTKINDDEFIISAKFACKNDGFSFPEVEPRLFSFNSPYGACPSCNGLGSKYFMGDEPCDACHGARLRIEALNVFLKSKAPLPSLPLGKGEEKGGGVNILDLASLSIADAHEFFKNLKLSEQEKEISVPVVKEIEARLQFMLDVGLDYLQLSRRANTLSGGESQRIRLASQLGSGLVGALYVLDEPTIGLHQRDNDRLIKTLIELRELGNTIIVVEHDEDTIRAADYLVDIGPGAGVHGGDVIVADDLQKLLTQKGNPSKSLTLDYLRGDRKIDVPKSRRAAAGAIKVRGGAAFNIKDLDADIPLGSFVCVTGVSGSGKSTFLYDIVHKNLLGSLELRHRTVKTYNCTSFEGATGNLSRVVMVDQSAIGRTPRSNPATYTGAFTHIRDLFAASGEARARGWKPGRFSFNVKGGRCEACQGNGQIAVEMHFLPTVYVECDVCNGKRFTKETLEVTYKGKNIHEVLNMTVEDAWIFFGDIPAIADRLRRVLDVGLGYLALGQSATTLSGGEAQRIKIAAELYRPDTYKTIYLLDEPTVGLHYEDVKKLIEILQQLVNRGNSVVVIEHNLDLIRSADYIIDFGPEGGDDGGSQ